MVNARGKRLLNAAACAAVLILAGCGDDDHSSDNDGSAVDGPIAEFMGWEDTGAARGPEFTEEDRQRHYRVQDLIVACMSEAGFEYTPTPFYGDREALEDPYAEVWQLQQDDPAAFAREYGYGFTTIDYDPEVLETPDASDDPNLAYRESLPAAAQEEYDKALWGDFEQPAEQGGCSSEAYKQVYGGGEDDPDEDQFQELFEEWDALYQRIENDPRMEEATQAWLGCMSGAGYPGLQDRYGGQNEVSKRQSELYGQDGGEDGQPQPAPVEPDPAELAALRQFEREIAVADYTCRQEHDVDGVEREVRREHEERFIEENREQLEAYRDWSNEQGRG